MFDYLHHYKTTRILGGFFVFLLLTLRPFTVMSQNKAIESTAFRLVVNGLLKHDVPEMTVPELMDQDTKDLVLLDARSKDEYEISHFKDAIWVGYESFSEASLNGIDKEAEILVYCSVGYRSEEITRKLKNLGYHNAKNLLGGVFEWVNQNGEVVKQGVKTDSIHGYSKMWGIWLKNGSVVY